MLAVAVGKGVLAAVQASPEVSSKALRVWAAVMLERVDHNSADNWLFRAG